MNTVKWVVQCMGLMPFTHIIVRKRGEKGIVALGGSCNTSEILARYGEMEVERSFIVDDILYFDVV